MCVCDEDGKVFETTPNTCAMFTADPKSGGYKLSMYHDEECTNKVSYAPDVLLNFNNPSLCERHGADIVELKADCPKYKPMCIHPGHIHDDEDQCSLSPKCPVTVQNPEQHCTIFINHNVIFHGTFRMISLQADIFFNVF